MSPPLLLASTSRYRRELLERLEVPFTVAAPELDERAHDERFAHMTDGEFAMHLARAKAESLVPHHPDHAILAADQICVLPGPPRILLHKSETIPRAVEQLMTLSGRTHVLTTAVVLRLPGGRSHEAVDVHHMTMRAFGEAEARAYVERHQPVDCVGSYRIEDAGIALFRSIRGDDHTGIVGLPLIAVARLLREAGISAATADQNG